MNKLPSFMPKKTLILIVSLIAMIVISSLVLLVNKPKETVPSPPPVVFQSPAISFPLQKSIIGRTTPDDVEKTYQAKNKQTLPNGDLEYSISSKLLARPDQIIFQNNLAKFERIVILGNSSNFLKISDMIIKYGPAEKMIKGSKFYGYFMDTYIYTSRGLAFIANTHADEVYEVQIFTPTTVDNYLSTYGEDIKENTGVKE